MALQSWIGRTAYQVDADSPVDTTLIQGIDEDLTHLRQVLYGDGAGGFYTATDGHDHDGVNSKNIAYWGDYTTGSIQLAAADTEQNTNSTSYTLKKQIAVARNGTVNVQFSIKCWQYPTAYGQIYINGSPVAGTEESTSSASYQTFSHDVSVSQDDAVELYIKNSDAAGLCYCQNFRVRSSTLEICKVMLD